MVEYYFILLDRKKEVIAEFLEKLPFRLLIGDSINFTNRDFENEMFADNYVSIIKSYYYEVEFMCIHYDTDYSQDPPTNPPYIKCVLQAKGEVEDE